MQEEELFTLLAEAFPLCFSALYCHSLRGFGCSRFVLVVSVPRKVFPQSLSSAQKQPKQNASSQNREENGSTTLKKHKGKASASRVKSSSSCMLKRQGYTERRNNHGKCDNFLPTKLATE